jgi:hypothetical protein
MSIHVPLKIHFAGNSSSIFRFAVYTNVAPLALVTYIGHSYYYSVFFSALGTETTFIIGILGCNSLALWSIKYPSYPSPPSSQAAPSR